MGIKQLKNEKEPIMDEVEKMYYEVTFIFGRNGGSSIEETGIIKNTRAEKENLISSFSWEEEYDLNNNEAFLNGGIGYCHLDNIGGDWDERNGTTITVFTYDQKKSQLDYEHGKAVRKLNELFNLI